MLSTDNTLESPKTSTTAAETPDFRKTLLTRHAADETICVSIYKHPPNEPPNGNFAVVERFCEGVDQASALIEHNYQKPHIGAFWTNIQRLKPGSSRRKKGETTAAYSNMIVDIDRKWKIVHEDGTLCKHSKEERKACGGHKCNATDGERAVLREVAEKINGFLAPCFPDTVFADSGNGYHVAGRCRGILEMPLEPARGEELYSRLLRLLKAKFEAPDLNVEIDASLSDETQVVTAWGTWNRKYPDTLDRPQRQSRILFMPRLPMREASEIDIELFLINNKLNDDGADLEGAAPSPAPTVKRDDSQKADPQWLENYGVPDLVEHFGKYGLLAYEGETYDKANDTYHPVTPCYCHEGEPDGHTHSHPNDCCIIEWSDGGIGVSCFSRDFGLKTMIKVLNERAVALGGEKYPHLVFAEESRDDVFKAFGAEDADKEAAGLATAEPEPEPEPGHESGEFELVRRGDEALIGITMDKIRSRRMEFLWDQRIPLGKGVVMHGSPGTGKSFAAIDVLARITTGKDWPDGAKNTMGPRRVLVAATEDDVEDTIKPRFQAAGADMSKVVWLVRVVNVADQKRRRMNLKDDTNRLHQMLRDNPDIAAILLDPITGFYGGDTDGNSNKHIRPMMEQVADVCRKTKVNVFAIIHENRRGDAAAIDKILGAGALGQVFRVVLRFSNDPKNKPHGRIMATTKVNLTKKQGGLRYEIGEELVTLDDGYEALVGRCVWGEEHDLTADDVVLQERNADKDGEASEFDKAKKLLEAEVPKLGRRLLSELHPLREKLGIEKKTMQRAAAALGIVCSAPPPPYFYSWDNQPRPPEEPKMGDPEDGL